MRLLKNCVALLRGNMICLFKKMWHPNLVDYHTYIRMFSHANITMRNKGSIRIGKNTKIDPYAVISVNGGEIVIGDQVGIGRNNIIVSQKKISIGAGTILAPNVLIYDHDHQFDHEKGVNITEYNCASVSIGKNCWIGANTVILKGTVIGDNCLVGAGSVIKGNYPSGSKIVQKRNTIIIEGDNHASDNSN